MESEKNNEAEIAHFVSRNLKQQYDASFSSVKVIIKKPFIVIHLQDFSFPTEAALLKRNEVKQIMETRDLLMNDWKDEVKEELASIIDGEVEEVYADWNLDNRTGMMIALMAEKDGIELARFPDDKTKRALQERISLISRKTEKVPDEMEIYWLNNYMILIERKGIMVEIEKELIKNGSEEELRLAKRPLEHRMMETMNIQELLNRKLNELFVDWDFKGDKAYMVFILEE
ncbi:uncharacterized protein YbcI [Planomicrobium soli]|uniref:Uncharacterized protein YbcI n=1 Tax=Planomicrobium soli TaxID=1176648 RepID=A0A2P8H451_9BACL|nr:Na-translocating system protein MpsC family protein [Planomicrobium soli]PSL40994.1 uncharacterized protein YbcI [Planomicrobium soli]